MKIVNISKKREKIVKRVYFLKIGTGTGCCTLRMYDEGTGPVERALLGTCRIPAGLIFRHRVVSSGTGIYEDCTGSLRG